MTPRAGIIKRIPIMNAATGGGLSMLPGSNSYVPEIVTPFKFLKWSKVLKVFCKAMYLN